MNERKEGQTWPGWFFFLLFGYFSAHVCIRVFLSDSLELDEAEQVLLSQWTLPGYTAQPPLYTWLQALLFKVLGLHVAALSILKNALLFSTYTLVYFSARFFLRDARLSVLSASSLLVIPTIAWEAQRDLTHTVLVIKLAAAALHMSTRLLKTRSAWNYALFGIVLGLGILSKYNFLIFAISLSLALLTTPIGRSALGDRRIFLSLFLMLVAVLPYFLWVVVHVDVASSSAGKFNMESGAVIAGLGSAAKAAGLFLAPLLLLYLFFFKEGFKAGFGERGTQRILERYFLFLSGILILMVIFFHVSYFKTRWMIPLLFLSPIYFFARLDPQKVSSASCRKFLKIPATAGFLILLLFPLRVVGGPFFDHYSDFNYPFQAMSEEIRKKGFVEGLIVSNRGHIAGNLHLQFPESTAYAPSLTAIDLSGLKNRRPLLVVWDAEKSRDLPSGLGEFMKNEFLLEMEGRPIHYVSVPYRYSRGRTAVMGILFLNGFADGESDAEIKKLE
jgi:lipopolysaccharide core galacturonosyltransferase RgtB